MKNSILSLVLALFTNLLSAQLTLGLEMNSSWSNMNIAGEGNLISSPNYYNGIKTGVNVSYPIYLGLGIESGLYYHTTGFKVSQDFGFDVYNIPIEAGVTAIPQFHYLETPLLLKYSFGDKVKASIGAGPYVGLAVDGEIKTRANFILDFNLGTYDLNLRNDLFNQWEIGLMTKAELKIPIQNWAINFNGQFQHGLNDLSDEPILNIRTKRYAFGLGAGLSYQF